MRILLLLLLREGGKEGVGREGEICIIGLRGDGRHCLGH